MADDVTRCLSLFVVLSVTEDALRRSVFFYCQEVAWQLKETGRVAFIQSSVERCSMRCPELPSSNGVTHPKPPGDRDAIYLLRPLTLAFFCGS